MYQRLRKIDFARGRKGDASTPPLDSDNIGFEPPTGISNLLESRTGSHAVVRKNSVPDHAAECFI